MSSRIRIHIKYPILTTLSLRTTATNHCLSPTSAFYWWSQGTTVGQCCGSGSEGSTSYCRIQKNISDPDPDLNLAHFPCPFPPLSHLIFHPSSLTPHQKEKVDTTTAPPSAADAHVLLNLTLSEIDHTITAPP